MDPAYFKIRGPGEERGKQSRFLKPCGRKKFHYTNEIPWPGSLLREVGLSFRVLVCYLRSVGLFNNYFKENETIPSLPQTSAIYFSFLDGLIKTKL